jgi:RNA polymerase-interacting CarD/CdnL/TRCF family regulator
MGESLEEKFAIGDQVVHPQHGVGFVAGLEEKQFKPNAARMYYVVSIPDITIWIPVERPSASGLRRLSPIGELEPCCQVLLGAPKTLNPSKDLSTNLSAHIKQGTMIAQCEVIRDLMAFGSDKPLYGSLADILRTALNVLSQEWAAVKGVTQAEASHEIDGLLKQGRATRKHQSARSL